MKLLTHFFLLYLAAANSIIYVPIDGLSASQQTTDNRLIDRLVKPMNSTEREKFQQDMDKFESTLTHDQ